MTIRIFDDSDLAKLKEVLDGGNLCSLSGTMTAKFEEAFARAMGVKHAVAYNSAMSVLHGAVAAAGAGAGDEVICDPMVQFGAVAVMYNNAVPVFADVRRDTHLVDPESIRERVTERTKAIICTHLWGLPCDMDPIMEIAKEHKLVVIEDVAHAIYAEYKGRLTGGLGHIGSFSFQQSKQMATGDGGMATTDDDNLWDRLVEYSGARGLATFPRLSWNYRMTELVAAVGLVQLERSRRYVEDAIANAGLYSKAVEDVEWIAPQAVPEGRRHTYHIWAATFEGEKYGIDYGKFQEAAKEKGAKVSFGYIKKPAYLHDLFTAPLAYGRGCPTGCPLYRGVAKYVPGLCPVAEDLMPRLMLIGTSGAKEEHMRNAERLRGAIDMFR